MNTNTAPNTLDLCPTCRRPITDTDPAGCEAPDGQRYCIEHLPDESSDPEVQAWLEEVARLELERTARAEILVDHLGPFGDDTDDDAGTIFRLCQDTWRNTFRIKVAEAGELERYRANAYDDDGERYYELAVYIPRDDELSELALESLLNQLGSYAGCTYLRFPRHPELDVG